MVVLDKRWGIGGEGSAFSAPPTRGLLTSRSRTRHVAPSRGANSGFARLLDAEPTLLCSAKIEIPDPMQGTYLGAPFPARSEKDQQVRSSRQKITWATSSGRFKRKTKNSSWPTKKRRAATLPGYVSTSPVNRSNRTDFPRQAEGFPARGGACDQGNCMNPPVARMDYFLSWKSL
jgi:hypothetical protein